VENNEFETLKEEYDPMIHSILHKLHIKLDYEEYYQTALIGLWYAANRFEEQKGHFSTFAYTTIRGEVLKILYKQSLFLQRSVQMEHDTLELIAEPAQDPILQKLLLSEYCTCLTPREKVYVEERIINDRSFEDIASRYNVSTETVKTWGKLAKRKLRNKYKK
jgi:RNA polymerase sigma factor (sigma-70 family)